MIGSRSVLGRRYADRDVIVRQGDPGDCMYVVQDGQVEVLQVADGAEQRLAVLGPGDFFGEMSLFEKQRRSATVRSLGKSIVLTVDKRTLLRRVSEDPLLAFNLLKVMCHRVRELDARLARQEGTSA